MTPPTDAEEYDPETGEFRPIRKAHFPVSARPSADRAPIPPRVTGLSESGEKYGVFYEIAESGLRTRGARIAEIGSKIVIVVVFLLLLYEAISYRLALPG
jgi:hypothetical protein